MLALSLVLALAVPFPAYGAAAPAAITTAPTSAAPSRIDLNQAIAIAAAASPQLAQARAALDLAQSDVSLARTPTLPALGVQATENIGGAEGILFQQRGVGLNLTQLLYDGGRTIAQVRAAQSDADAANGTYRRALQTLAYKVAQTYYAALLTQSRVQLQLHIVAQDRAQEQLIVAQIRAGTAARIDVETAQIPTAQARVEVVRAQGDALAAQAAFVSALGLSADAAVAPINTKATLAQTNLPRGTTLNYNRAVTRALHLRPDYIGARAQLRASNAAIRATRLGFAPSLMLQGTAGSSSYAGFTGWQSSSQIGAALNIPVYDQGITDAQIQRARAQQRSAQARFDATKLTVQFDVRQALVQLIAQQAALAQTKIELAKASDVLSATQTQYRAGQTTLPLLLNAQSQLAGAESDRLTAQFALRESEETYLYALGGNVLAEEMHQ